MKKITTLFTAALLLIASVSFAADGTPVPSRISDALSSTFENASNIAWKTVGAYYKASFKIGEQSYGAYYNFSGDLIATSRKLSVENLPMSLQKDLKQIAPVYHEEDLIELLSEDNGTEYFVQFSDGKESKSYKSSGDSWIRM